ncbi:hypothetical protein J6590_027012 [Homalodisca vitripennis]|nr:hypothetical protein J6590_027012 [Homalodisca vitripennis]
MLESILLPYKREYIMSEAPLGSVRSLAADVPEEALIWWPLRAPRIASRSARTPSSLGYSRFTGVTRPYYISFDITNSSAPSSTRGLSRIPRSRICWALFCPGGTRERGTQECRLRDSLATEVS